MGTRTSEGGFTLVELMLASMITLVVMGVAFSTFKDALALNDTVVQVTDASQNLRAGTNLLIRDLLQAGRSIPTGGIAIPSGAKATAIRRPGPPGSDYVFDKDTTLTAITTGAGLGPAISGKRTDLVTILVVDPYLEPLTLYPWNVIGDLPRLASDGSSFDVGSDTTWLAGDPANAVPPIAEGDLIYFSNWKGTTLQTVTDVTDSVVSFAADDPFNLNQRNAGAGSMTEMLPKPCAETQATCLEGVGIKRVLMFTYYVHEETPGVPRLMRQVNHGEPQALAGVVDTLDLSYDLVGGTQNPTNVKSLPYTTKVGDVSIAYGANQIRKVNLRVGVRSEFISPKAKDYLRNHLSTVVSLRNLAYVDRYDTDPAEDQ
jgi:type II secretory pathway pseudopilin PulG